MYLATAEQGERRRYLQESPSHPVPKLDIDSINLLPSGSYIWGMRLESWSPLTQDSWGNGLTSERSPFFLIVWVVIESISQRWDPTVYLCLLLAPIISHKIHPYPALLLVRILGAKPPLFQTSRGSRLFSQEKGHDWHWALMGFH